MQCHLIRLIVSIAFVLIDAINSVDRINRINRIDCIGPGVLNYSALQLKYNSNDPTKYGIKYWVKKG